MKHAAITDSVADRIAQALVRHGVEVIFAQSLPSAVILAAEACGIRQIAYRQENMGGAMADGYARVSSKVGVVAAQNGPAATLLVPPLAEAMKSSIPVVALVQDVERNQTDKNAFQDIDQIALFQSCTKWVRRLNVAERVDDYIDAAFTAATSGRAGPVALLLPADLLRSPAPKIDKPRTACLGYWPLDRFRPSDDLIQTAADTIADAHNPVVLAGGGIHAGGAAAALARLQEIASLPVFTTNMGKGAVDEFHPLSAGVLGALSGPRSLGFYSHQLMKEADLVILAGTRTNQNGTDNWQQIPPSAKIIHIDIDPGEIGRNYEALRLHGDAHETLTALCEALSKRDFLRRDMPRLAYEKRIAGFWAEYDEARQPVLKDQTAMMRPERVMQELQPWIEQDITVVADASYSSMWVVGQLRCRKVGTRFITPRGLAGLGWGLPLAMGVKVAHPDNPVVAIVGDGGFAHSWAELETMIRMQLPVTVVLLNNGVLGFQKDAETVKFGRYTTACHFAPVDHAAVASACGCRSATVDNAADFSQQLRLSIESGKPSLIEVITDPDAHPPLSLFAAMDQAA
ncbi:acetolactate synthase catalytic subunit [Ochrobactrum sp. Q0168]|uniref:acetolactate synthase catalytic subunit n=1 Tax=Ochrobactrum sp. Q0168 TaxID=2793241 RepID=UPI0018EDE009|nr:acetolactate synthase catalytic subunit [Ochrobactrum sp. Q0168]